MAALTYPIISASAFGACGYRAWAFRGRGGLDYFAVTAAFADLGLTFAVSSPAMAARIDHATGIHKLAVVLGQMLALVFSLCVLTVVLEWTGTPRRTIAAAWAGGGVGIAAMAALFSACPVLPEAVAFDPADVRAWQFAVYLVVYCTVFGVCQTATTRVCLQMASAGGPPWLRRGLRTTAAGAVVGLAYCLVRLIDAAPPAWGIPDLPESGAKVLITVGVFLPIAGWTMPSAVPEAVDWWQSMGHRRALRRLEPLWRDLTEAAPLVVLDQDKEPTGIRMPQRTAFRATRRQAEIWDALRLLQPAFSGPAPASPHAAAVWFADGIARHRNAARAHRADGADEPETENGDARNAAGMDADWLYRVADHYRKDRR